MSWIVVKFSKENNIETVPKRWITSCQNYCYWPPKSDNVEKAIRHCKKIELNWEKHEVIVLSKKSYDSFNKASAKANRACEISDLSETETECEGRVQRRIQPLANDDFVYGFSSESEEDSFAKKLPEAPQAPLSMTPKGPYTTSPKASLPARLSLKSKSLAGTSFTKASRNLIVGSPLVNDQTELAGSGAVVFSEKHFEQLLKKLTVIREHQKQQDERLEEITRDLKTVTENLLGNVNITASGLAEDNLMDKLPLKTQEEVNSFNECLGNDHHYKQLVKSLSRLGGIHYKEGVRRVMAKLMSDDLALKYSFKGHKGKCDFSKLKMSDCVIEAVVIIDSQRSSTKDIEGAVAIWLSKAKERIDRKNEK